MDGDRRHDWVNLRDSEGNIQARYNPRLKQLVIQRRGIKTMHDLATLEVMANQETSVRAIEPKQLP